MAARLFALLFLALAACGPTVVHAPADMSAVARVRLAPQGLGFEVELPADARSESGTDSIEGFDEPIVSTSWTIHTADGSASFEVAHLHYPGGLGGNAEFVTRMLRMVPQNFADTLGGRVASRREVRPSRGVRGVQFRVVAPDGSALEGRLYFRDDVSILAVYGASRRSEWNAAGQRMLRTLRFL